MSSSPGGTGGGGRIPRPKKYFCYQCDCHVDIVPDEIFCPVCGNGSLQESVTPPQSSPSGGASTSAVDASGSSQSPDAAVLQTIAHLQWTGSNLQLLAALNSIGDGALRPTNHSDFLTHPDLQNLDVEDIDPDRNGTPPASQSAIDGLTDVIITDRVLDSDSTPCAVCKDAFVIGDKAKQMPCTHIYHTDCILPWLNLRNTCPSCRFQLPTDDPVYENARRTLQSSDDNNGGGRRSNRLNTFFFILPRQHRLLRTPYFPSYRGGGGRVRSGAEISDDVNTNGDEAVQREEDNSTEANAEADVAEDA